MPLVCWQCYQELASESQLYASFRQCLQDSKGEKWLVAVLGLVLLMMLA
jgi:hypothetical protein